MSGTLSSSVSYVLNTVSSSPGSLAIEECRCEFILEVRQEFDDH